MAVKKSELQYVIDGYVNSKFYKSIKSAQNAIARTNNFLKGNNTLQAQSAAAAKKAARSNSLLGSGLLKTALGAAGAYIGFSTLSDGYKECIAKAEEQMTVTNRLRTLMMNHKGTTLAQVKALQAYDSKLSETTVLTGKALMAGQSELASYQMSAKAIKALSPALANLTVGQFGLHASQEQAQQSAKFLGKAFTGNITAFKRLGITLTKDQQKVLQHGKESQKTALILDLVKRKYGDLAVTAANTPIGRQIQINKAWNKIKTTIGMGLYPIQEKLLKYLANHLPQIKAFVEQIIVKVQGWAKSLKPVWSFAYKIGTGIVKHWSAIRPVVFGIIAAILTWKAVIGAVTIVERTLNTIERIQLGYTKAKIIATKAAAAAQWLWNTSLAGCPIILVIAGVAALIAGIYLLIKNWDKVKSAMSRAWQWFIRFATEGPGRFIPVISIIGLVAKHWDVVKAAIVRAWRWVVRFVVRASNFIPVIAAIKFLIKHWDLIKSAVIRAYIWVKNFVIKASNFNPIVIAIKSIIKYWDKITEAIQKAWNLAKKFGSFTFKFTPVGVATNMAQRIAGRRASGGPVSAGRRYLVGERGPEYFVPKISGMILPNKAPRMAAAGSGAGGGITINLTINTTGSSGNVESGLKQGTDYLIRELRKLARDEERRSFA
ncbi:MAG: hypothetical protein ABFD64_09440 [Armatimonadota bacterium]